MLPRKKKDQKLDVTRLNELIKTGNNILKTIFILGIVAFIALGSYVLKEWEVKNSIITILKTVSPLFIGIVIAWLLDPAVRVLESKGVNRNLSTVMVFIGFVSLIIFIFYLFIPSFINQFQEVVAVFPKLIDSSDSWIKSFFENLNDLYSFDFSKIQKEIYHAFSNISESVTIVLPNKIVGIVGSVISGSVTFLIGLIIGLYMLFDFKNVRRQLLVFVPKRFHGDTLELTDNLNKNLRNYVQGILVDTSILFLFQTLAFWLVGLKAPLVFGLICAVTNIIPYVGPYIGGAPAVLVGFTIDPTVGIFTFIAVFVSQAFESYVLNPLIMSKTMKLHPVTIIIWLLIFGHFFGILGMILSTPIVSCLKVIFNFFENKFEIFERIKNE